MRGPDQVRGYWILERDTSSHPPPSPPSFFWRPLQPLWSWVFCCSYRYSSQRVLLLRLLGIAIHYTLLVLHSTTIVRLPLLLLLLVLVLVLCFFLLALLQRQLTALCFYPVCLFRC